MSRQEGMNFPVTSHALNTELPLIFRLPTGDFHRVRCIHVNLKLRCYFELPERLPVVYHSKNYLRFLAKICFFDRNFTEDNYVVTLNNCMCRLMDLINQVSSSRPATADTLHTELFTSFDDISIPHSEWDEFIESVGGEIFLTYDWCRTWWKYYGDGRQLMIYIFRDSQNSLCGIMPVFSESLGLGFASVRVVKMVGSDFMPITFSIPVREDRLEIVTHAFLDLLNEKCHWDLLYLGAICGKYSALPKLVNAFECHIGRSYRISINKIEVQTYFNVENSWDEQVANLSSRQRTKTKRVFKEIQNKGIELSSSFANESNFLEMYEHFVKMHQERWLSIGLPGHFIDWPHAYDFHKEIAGVGIEDRVRLLQIRLNENVIGYEYLYKFADTYYWYLLARSNLENDSKIDFHRVSFREKILSALNDRVQTIDAGRGTYEYKLVMGGQLKPVRCVFVESKILSSRIKMIIFYSLILMSNILYSKIWRRRVVPKLGFKPRPFWSWWIKTHMLSRVDPTRCYGNIKEKLMFLRVSEKNQ